MKIEEIKTGHTYEVTGGNRWRVESITGEHAIVFSPHVSHRVTLRGLASVCVRDVTPEPPSRARSGPEKI